jgi:hypothetical protein
MTARRLPPTPGHELCLAGPDRKPDGYGLRQAAVISVADPAVWHSVRTEIIPQPC